MANNRRTSSENFGESHVLSDIMGGIIFFLILFIFIQQIQFVRIFERMKIKQLQEYVRGEIVSAFENNSFKERIPRINIDEGNPLLQKIILSNDDLRFASADVKITHSADRKILRIIGEIMKKNDDIFESITIEGHADTVPISTDCHPTNWELSVGRATSVVRFLADSIRFNPCKLISAGFSSYHPIDADSIHLNRRIEVVVRYSYDKKFMRSKRANEIYQIVSETGIKKSDEKKGDESSDDTTKLVKGKKAIPIDTIVSKKPTDTILILPSEGVEKKTNLKCDVNVQKVNKASDSAEVISQAGQKTNVNEGSSNQSDEIVKILNVLKESENYFGKSDDYIISSIIEINRNGNKSQKDFLCYQLKALDMYTHLNCLEKLRTIDSIIRN